MEASKTNNKVIYALIGVVVLLLIISIVTSLGFFVWFQDSMNKQKSEYDKKLSDLEKKTAENDMTTNPSPSSITSTVELIPSSTITSTTKPSVTVKPTETSAWTNFEIDKEKGTYFTAPSNWKKNKIEYVRNQKILIDFTTDKNEKFIYRGESPLVCLVL